MNTIHGVSAPFVVRVHAPTSLPPPTVLDVPSDFGGDLLRALAKAATLRGPTTLELGARVYELTDTRLTIPPNATLRGLGADRSGISLSLGETTPRGACCSPRRR